MAYTEAQWNQFQATLPPEERISYLAYLRAADPAAYNKFIGATVSNLKADSAPTPSPITVVDERGKIVGARTDTAAQRAAQRSKANTVSSFRAKEALDAKNDSAATVSISAVESAAQARAAARTTPTTTTPVTTTPVTTTPVTVTPVVTPTPKSPELIELERLQAEALRLQAEANARNEKVQAAKAKFDKKQPLTAEDKALLGLDANFEYDKTSQTDALTKEFADATAQNEKVQAAYARFQKKEPLTAEDKALLDLPPDYEYAGAGGSTVVSTTATGATGATGDTVFTQAQLDAAVKAAQDKAIAELRAKTEQEKRDAEIAAAAALAAGNNKGSLTQADLDRAIREALAQQEAKAEALKREALAEADAKALAQKQKASDRLVSIFTGYGLETLAGFIDRRIKADVSEDMILLELYDQPEYQLRFPGMKALRTKNRTITENEYMKIENQYTQAARFFDLPKGFYDSPDDFGKLIGNEVSATEFQNRLQVGQDLARAMSPAARTQLQQFYNIGEGGITAYVLDADKALPLIQKQAKAAQFVGFGRERGFKLEGMTAAQAEQIAGTEAYAKLSGQQMQQALSQAALLRNTQSRLTGIEGEVYNEQEALSAVIEGSPEALLASQQRAQREGARFGGSGGVTGSSLRSAPGL
jgi:hypothetical protein